MGGRWCELRALMKCRIDGGYGLSVAYWEYVWTCKSYLNHIVSDIHGSQNNSSKERAESVLKAARKISPLLLTFHIFLMTKHCKI